MRKLISILIFFFICYSLQATTYYVNATSGNDANAGTSTGAAWKTLTKVNSHAYVAGDNILFNRGDIFYGSLTASNSGSAGNPITYGAYGSGANPVISGFNSTAISFSNLSGNIWESTSAVSTLSTCNIVVINGVNTPIGRTPNTGWYTYQSHSGTTSITSSSLNSAVTNWTGAQLVMRSIRWMVEVNPITAQSGSTLTYTGGSSPGTNGYGFFIQNDVRTLTYQNAWYYNPSNFKIRIYSTSTPTGVQLPTVTTLVTANKNYITFDGIDFTGANMSLMDISTAQHITVQNCNFSYAENGIYSTSSTISLTQNCTFRNLNNHAARFKNFTSLDSVKNCTIDSIGMIAGSYFETDQNSTDAIVFAGANSSALYNTITNIGHIGLYYIWTNGQSAYYNYIANYGMTRYDAGGIYSWNGDTTSVPVTTRIFDHNIINGSNQTISGINGADPGLYGIYLDGDSKNCFLTNNTSTGNYTAGIYVLNSGSLQITGNTLYNNNLAQIEYKHQFGGGMDIKNCIVKNNIYIAKPSTQLAMFYSDDSAHFHLGYSDSNYYARPIDDNLTINTQIIDGGAQTSRNLAMWQTFSGLDANSKKSPAAITNVNQLFFAYNPNSYDSTIIIPSGTWIDVTGAPFNTGSTILHAYTSIVLMSTGSLIIPTIDWTPTPITYGTGLGVAQLNAVAKNGVTVVTGTHVYTHGTGYIGNVPSFSNTDNFTPSDPLTYSTATKTITQIVNPDTLSGIVYNTTVTYNSFPQQPVLTTSPVAGVANSFTLNGVSGGRVAAGSYTYIFGVTDPNYYMVPLTGTFTIQPKAGTFTVSNTTVPYDSLLHTVSVTTSDPAITYTISGAPQRYKGTYSVTVHNTNTNFSVPDAVVTLTITAGNAPPLVWNPATPQTYPYALDGAVLNAGDAKSGVYHYTPLAGFIPSAGSLQLKVDFVPNDTNLAPIIGTTRTITINKGTDVMTASDTIQYADGNPKPITVTTLHGGTVVITYDGSTTTPPSSIGDHPYSAVYSDANYQATTITGTLHILSNSAIIKITNFANRPFTGLPIDVTVNCLYPYTLVYTPSNHTDVNNNIQVIATINDGGVHVGADTVIMSIIPATPSGTWSPIAPQTYIYTVQSGILNANVSVAGSGTYNVSVGDTLIPGTYNLIYNFTPSSSNYNPITLTNSITVNKGSAVINVSGTSKQYNTFVQYITATTTPPNLDSLVVTYTGAHTNAGSYPFTAMLFSNLYTASTVSGTLTISQGSYTLSWATPLAIQSGTPLSSIQYNPSSSIPVTFTFNYPIGTILPTGITILTATAHPTDSVNYPVQTISVAISVYGNPLLQYFIKHGKFYPVDYPQ